MDHRLTSRVPAVLPVRVWGLDAHAQPFTQQASVTNISGSGAAIRGLLRRVRTGEILEVQFGAKIGQFRVMWVGRMGSDQEGEVGVVSLPSQPSIWNVNLGMCVQMAANV